MKKYALALSVLLAAGLALWSPARESTSEVARVRVSLRDGSLLVGSPDWRTLKLNTAFGELQMPVSSIVRIDLTNGSNGVVLSVLLTNRDVISGSCKAKELELNTSFGVVALPLAQVRTMDFTPSREMLRYANTTWRYARGDGSVIARALTLQPDGTVGGYDNPNERRWTVQQGNLVFLDAAGSPTTVFDRRDDRNGLQTLGGPMIGNHEYHVLEELKASGKAE